MMALGNAVGELELDLHSKLHFSNRCSQLDLALPGLPHEGLLLGDDSNSIAPAAYCCNETD